MIKFNFIPHFAIRIVCAFIFFTATGTFTHELGHLSVAKYYGYDTHLSYGSVHYFYKGYYEDPLYVEYKNIWEENYEAFQAKEDFPQKEHFRELGTQLSKKYPPKPEFERAMITLGGPVQTLLTTFLGLFILFYRRSKEKEYFVLLDWLGVFLALFCLREVFNYVMAVFRKIFMSKSEFRDDEFRLSLFWDLPLWVVPTIAFVIGLSISLYVIFKVIPLKYRFTFIAAGFAGGVLGFFVWLRWLGPVVLPEMSY